MGFAAPELQTVQAIAAAAGAQDVPAIFLNPLKQSAQDEEANGNELSSSLRVPVVDMAALVNGDEDLDNIEAAEEIARACREWGFVQIVNHGVPQELVNRMRDVALEYFHMPAKDRVIDGVEKPATGTRDWNDALVHFPKPHRPDVTLRTKWPAGYREVLHEYVEEVLKLANRLRRVLSLKLGLSPTHLEEVMEELEAVVRVNYYPRCPQPEWVTGLSAHSDAGFLTVLLMNEVEGLQVLKNGRWVTLQVLPNSLVINVADMFQIISNGAYVSCEHRAFVNPHSERLSVVVFVNPAGNLTLGPLPELVDAHNPPLYKPVSFGEYIAAFRSRPLNGKSLLESLEICSHD